MPGDTASTAQLDPPPADLAGARVLVTGEQGRIGSATAQHLMDRGADVVGATDRQIDTRDATAVAQAMTGIDLVVHLAAIPAPHVAPWPEVFSNNVTSTFNVLWAAGEAGVGRVVLASSINVSGLPFNSHPVLPAYFPFDEELPTDLDDPYSLSKTVDELSAGMAVRHWGLDVVAIRFPFTAAEPALVEHAEQLTADPESGVREGWTYLDVRDAARVVELSLTRPLTGLQTVFVCADQTAVPYPTEALLDAFAPEVPRRRTVAGRDVPVDLNRARTLLGFRAQHPLDLGERPYPPVA